MSAYTIINFNMNNNDAAVKTTEIIKRVAAKRTPEFETEIEAFTSSLKIEENVITGESDSLSSNTFCELIPQIMMEIARYNFGVSTMTAVHVSCSCGYEAVFNGRIFKNGKFRMSFHEHE